LALHGVLPAILVFLYCAIPLFLCSSLLSFLHSFYFLRPLFPCLSFFLLFSFFLRVVLHFLHVPFSGGRTFKCGWPCHKVRAQEVRRYMSCVYLCMCVCAHVVKMCGYAHVHTYTHACVHPYTYICTSLASIRYVLIFTHIHVYVRPCRGWFSK
jgi:hypothetical protein